MSERKRKEVSAQNEKAPKKSKKSTSERKEEALKPAIKTTSPKPSFPTEVVASSQDTAIAEQHVPKPGLSSKTRKRAIDFLDEEEQHPPNSSIGTLSDKKKVKFADTITDGKSSKKSKKSKTPSSTPQSLTADGVNGVLEDRNTAEAQPVTAGSSISTSLQAEAQRTADQELDDEFGPLNGETVHEQDLDDEEGIDQAANLLTGLDSDTEDPAEDQGLDVTRLGAVPNYKKTQKKLLKAKKEGNQSPGVVYVGRVPHGFYELQMREYFSQFGDISRLRLSRNKRTAASKHFGFIEFKSEEVAKIVAESMDNYLMFGHILKCKYVPQDTLHPEVWKGANKRYRRIPHTKMERESLAAPKTQSHWEKKVEREKRKREVLAAKLKELDYDMPQSNLTNPSNVIHQRKVQNDTEDIPLQIEDGKRPSITDITNVDVIANSSKPQDASKKKQSKKSKIDSIVPTEEKDQTPNGSISEPKKSENTTNNSSNKKSSKDAIAQSSGKSTKDVKPDLEASNLTAEPKLKSALKKSKK